LQLRRDQLVVFGDETYPKLASSLLLIEKSTVKASMLTSPVLELHVILAIIRH
jgi:hypothetical protein